MKRFREYEDLTLKERKIILLAFKKDYQGHGFRDKYLISIKCLRKLREESKIFVNVTL